MPQPRSGRFFIWYGWNDDRHTGEFPRYVAKILTHQCSHMFKNGVRCQKEVCLGSDLCVDHLNWIGIEAKAKYKPKSNVVDTISRINTNRASNWYYAYMGNF